MCGDYIEWDLSQDRSEIIDKVCPSCKENPPPPHKRRKYISISKYTKPTRKDVRDSLKALLGSGVLMGIGHIAFETKGLLFPWLSSLPFIIVVLMDAYKYIKDNRPSKRFDPFSIVICLPFMIASFASPVVAMMFAFMFYIFGGLGLLGYSLLILLNPYLSNINNRT